MITTSSNYSIGLHQLSVRVMMARKCKGRLTLAFCTVPGSARSSKGVEATTAAKQVREERKCMMNNRVNWILEHDVFARDLRQKREVWKRNDGRAACRLQGRGETGHARQSSANV